MADLVRSSDVFLQNFRHGTAERLGIGYEQLRQINPRLVYCSISGYGSTGPYRDRPGQDLVVQGYSGSMFSVGSADDPPEPGALRAADVMTGYQAAIGILAALHARERIGVGQHVEVDMLSVVFDAQLQELVTFLNAGRKPVRTAEASAHAFIPAPYGVYRTQDGWLTLAMTLLASLGEVLDDDFGCARSPTTTTATTTRTRCTPRASARHSSARPRPSGWSGATASTSGPVPCTTTRAWSPTRTSWRPA